MLLAVPSLMDTFHQKVVVTDEKLTVVALSDPLFTALLDAKSSHDPELLLQYVTFIVSPSGSDTSMLIVGFNAVPVVAFAGTGLLSSGAVFDAGALCSAPQLKNVVVFVWVLHVV